MKSRHYLNQRNERERFIREYLGGDGNVVDSFVVDKGHENGLERHDITDNGIIVIYNYHTNILVSKLIARAHQILRYYKGSDRKPPMWLICLARWHESLGYNHI